VLVSEGLERLNRQTVEELFETFQVALHDILIDRVKTDSQSSFLKRKTTLEVNKKRTKCGGGDCLGAANGSLSPLGNQHPSLGWTFQLPVTL